MKIWKSIALALSTFAIMAAAFILSSAAPKAAMADASSSQANPESTTMYLATSVNGVKQSTITITRGTSDDGKLSAEYFLINTPIGTTKPGIRADSSNLTQDGISL